MCQFKWRMPAMTAERLARSWAASLRLSNACTTYGWGASSRRSAKEGGFGRGGLLCEARGGPDLSARADNCHLRRGLDVHSLSSLCPAVALHGANSPQIAGVDYARGASAPPFMYPWTGSPPASDGDASWHYLRNPRFWFAVPSRSRDARLGTPSNQPTLRTKQKSYWPTPRNCSTNAGHRLKRPRSKRTPSARFLIPRRTQERHPDPSGACRRCVFSEWRARRSDRTDRQM